MRHKPETLILTRYIVAWYKCKIPLRDRIFENFDEAVAYMRGVSPGYRPRLEEAHMKLALRTISEAEISQYSNIV